MRNPHPSYILPPRTSPGPGGEGMTSQTIINYTVYFLTIALYITLDKITYGGAVL